MVQAAKTGKPGVVAKAYIKVNVLAWAPHPGRGFCRPHKAVPFGQALRVAKGAANGGQGGVIALTGKEPFSGAWVSAFT